MPGASCRNRERRRNRVESVWLTECADLAQDTLERRDKIERARCRGAVRDCSKTYAKDFRNRIATEEA